jgi:hypothetical protein
MGHALLVGAAQACTNLGHPELQEHLYEETGNEDYAPNRRWVSRGTGPPPSDARLWRAGR